MSQKNALGKGLSALLENASTDITSGETMTATTQVGAIANIDITKIEPNPFQPRVDFDEDSLKELAKSIKVHDLIQPLTVRKLGYDEYQLISGERRYRASKIAGLKTVPAYIRVANDQEMVEMALIENIQREDLNAIEIAISYQRLVEECSMTQEEVASRMGKNRTTVTNYMRLLKLPPEIQMGLRSNDITMGHARAIINVDVPEVQLDLYFETVSRQLSVREVEELARQYSPRKGSKPASVKKELPLEYREIESNLSNQLDSRVKISLKGADKGTINIPFHSNDDLNRILDLLGSK
ncbi:ParB/RepB/Spo0J family partition protein [bacterium AH-315-C07]|nr:ParB/RepB/Spo0J family partition protein [bacterium AH-315-C07]